MKCEAVCRVLMNGLIVAGISLFSQLLYYGYPPQSEHLYIAGLTFGITLLTFITRLFNGHKKNGNTSECSDNHNCNKSEITKTLIERKPKMKSNGETYLWF